MATKVFILLFRGINVGGNKIVKMETLRRVLGEAGFDDVASYIQSGNVVLSSDKSESTVTALVEKTFDATFGFSSRPTIRTLDAWKKLISDNPFAKASEVGKRVHAVVLDAKPTEASIESLKALATTEELAFGEGVLYLHTPDGFGTSKVSAAFDKLLKIPLTARNWNTVLKLGSMAEAISQK